MLQHPFLYLFEAKVVTVQNLAAMLESDPPAPDLYRRPGKLQQRINVIANDGNLGRGRRYPLQPLGFGNGPGPHHFGHLRVVDGLQQFVAVVAHRLRDSQFALNCAQLLF